VDDPKAQTPQVEAGKLPVDFKGDKDGNVKISGGKEVPPVTERAREGEKPSKEQTPEQPKVAEPRMISEEEVTRRLETIKGGHKGTVEKMRGEIDALTKKLTETMELGKQMEYDNWMRLLQESGDGKSLDVAKKVFAMDKQTRAERLVFEKERAEVMTLKAELDQAGKMKFVENS